MAAGHVSENALLGTLMWKLNRRIRGQFVTLVTQNLPCLGQNVTEPLFHQSS